VNASEFGSTHKRDAGADTQVNAVSSGIAVGGAVSAMSAQVESAVVAEVPSPVKSQVSPIPSMVTPQAAPAMAEAPKMKYKITVMPEATCDGCQ
jgi:hypothetical protein